MRGTVVSGNGAQRSEPARSQPEATMPGTQDSQLWTVKKPKGLLQTSTPPQPTPQNKPIGSQG
jgi:hypothetical protein